MRVSGGFVRPFCAGVAGRSLSRVFFAFMKVSGVSVASVAGYLAVLVDCSPTLPAPQLAPHPASSRETGQARLLLFPEANAEALLGRAVQISSDGSWSMADARAPGCEVAIRREKAQFRSARQVDVHSMTAFAGSYAALVSMEAKFGRKNTAEIVVENSEVLHGDIRGACGEYVIDTVFVGRGSRKLAGNADASGKVDVNAGPVRAAPGFDANQSLSDSIEWTDNQAR